MAVKETEEDQQALGPSVVLGLVGAVVVLLLLGAGIWGVGKIISKIRESGEDEEEQVAEETEEESESEEEEGTEIEETEGEEASEEEGEINGDAVTDEEDSESDSETEETEQQEDQEENPEEEADEGEEEEESGEGIVAATAWVANNYKEGDITGDSYTIVWGDTLWEIAEARYGSGFEWGKIRDANLDKIGYLPNGSRALIIPGQVLRLP